MLTPLRDGLLQLAVEGKHFYRAILIFVVIGAMSGGLSWEIVLFAVEPNDNAYLSGLDMFVPGLVFGIIFGLILSSTRVVHYSGIITVPIFATLSYFIGWSTTYILSAAQYDNDIGGVVLSGLCGGYLGSSAFVVMMLSFRVFRGRNAMYVPVVCGALLGALFPKEASHTTAFFALWQGGFAGSLVAAHFPRRIPYTQRRRFWNRLITGAIVSPAIIGDLFVVGFWFFFILRDFWT